MDARRKGRTGSGRGRWRDRRARAIDIVRGVLGHRNGPTPRFLRLTVRGERRLESLRCVDGEQEFENDWEPVIIDILTRVTDEEERDGLS